MASYVCGGERGGEGPCPSLLIRGMKAKGAFLMHLPEIRRLQARGTPCRGPARWEVTCRQRPPRPPRGQKFISSMNFPSVTQLTPRGLCSETKSAFPKSSPDDSCPASSLLTFGANDPLSSCVLQAFSSIPGPHPPAASNNPPTPHHPASITQNASGPCQMPPGDELASLRSWPGRAGPVPPGQTSTLY